jgi:hypothetical protein
MPTPTLTEVDLRRQAFSNLLSALKGVAPDLVIATVDAFPHDPPLSAPEAIEAFGRLKAIPEFVEWATFRERRWRDDPKRDPPGAFLSMIPVSLVGPVPLDRADLQRPILAHPEHETKEHFLRWASAHYDARQRAVEDQNGRVDRVAERPRLKRDAEWYVRHWIFGCTLADINPDQPNDVSRQVNEFANLLGAPLVRRRGRPVRQS